MSTMKPWIPATAVPWTWLGTCLLAGACAVWVSESRAMQVAAGRGTPTASEAVRGEPRVQAPAAATLELIPGTVVSVDASRTSLVLSGQTVRWHPTQLRLFHSASGTPAQVAQLRPGTRIRFALEPSPAGDASAAPERRIVLIYLETQP
ncbi:hypothetical protein [Sphaerotilus sp.]|jgi:hypothetical protein|uniref:hypothetical protein n=1 Tax=Sphaerotilus sp. TaxID=2093942 RepID=UPI0025D82AD5|nr:hypothetical protein [Sphaerotilus sp.]